MGSESDLMKRILSLIFAAILSAGLAGQASADLIVEYDGIAGTSQTGTIGTLASSALDLTRGAGINAATGDSFNSNNFDSATLADAIAADEFLSFGFTPAAPVDLTDIQVALDRSNTGPTTVYLFSSIGGFTPGDQITSAAIPDPVAIVNFDISSLTNVSTATEFRFYYAGATSGAGTSDIEDDLIGGSGNVGLQVNGVAAAVIPEPSSMALLGLVGLAGIVRRRK